MYKEVKISKRKIQCDRKQKIYAYKISYLHFIFTVGDCGIGNVALLHCRFVVSTTILEHVQILYKVNHINKAG